MATLIFCSHTMVTYMEYDANQGFPHIPGFLIIMLAPCTAILHQIKMKIKGHKIEPTAASFFLMPTYTKHCHAHSLF